MEEIRRQIALPAFQVISFDVFDTLLLRPLSDPDDLFRLMQTDFERLSGRTHSFRQLRKDAERHARAAMQQREDITLADIYRALAQTTDLAESLCRQLMALETSLELQLIQPRPAGCELLRHALDCRKRVILTSDMYLPASTVEAMLHKCGLDGWEHIFMSGEVGCIKSSGNLYRHASRTMSVPLRSMLHIGDHPLGDGESARWTGLSACVYRRPMTALHAYAKRTAETGSIAEGCLQALVSARFLDEPFDPQSSRALLGYAALGPWMLLHSAEDAPADLLPHAQAFLQDWQQLDSLMIAQETFSALWPIVKSRMTQSPLEQAEALLADIAALRAPCRQDRPFSGHPLVRRVKYHLYRFPRVRKALSRLTSRV